MKNNQLDLNQFFKNINHFFSLNLKAVTIKSCRFSFHIFLAIFVELMKIHSKLKYVEKLKSQLLNDFSDLI